MRQARHKGLRGWQGGALAGCIASCSIGEGVGEVQSDNLFLENCWDGPYALRPNFFAANPYRDDLSIRIQRSEESVLDSDGISLLVHDIDTIRTSRLNERLPLALPIGVTPLGFQPPHIADGALANMTLYLNDSCPGQNATLSAVNGWVQFEQLFSGDPNENRSEDRWTVGSFSAQMIDPRDAIPDPSAPPGEVAFAYPPDRVSTVSGTFRFVFHRGTPAQPFP